jgi:DNA-binding NarL/FixJ family response regulator
MTTKTRQKRIFVVDDHPLVREWLTNLINQQADLIVCGESDNMAATLSAVGVTQPDLLIADINLKNSSGFELIKTLKTHYPSVFVLALSMHDESLYAERVFRAGAHGYINKRETSQKVVEAIRRVIEGRLYVSEKTAEILAIKTICGRAVSRSTVGLLSNRELEVFDKLGQGVATKQIAADFHVSIKTIQEYCARIKEKLNLHSATELVREAVRWHDECNESNL